jgi:hypothetical protein
MVDTIWIVASILMFVASTDPHAHRCDCCNVRWWHLGLLSAGNVHSKSALRAHTCECGEQQWQRLRLRAIAQKANP